MWKYFLLLVAIAFGVAGCDAKKADAQWGGSLGGFGPTAYGADPVLEADAISAGNDYANAERLSAALAARRRSAAAALMDAEEMRRNNVLLRRYLCERFCGPLSPLANNAGYAVDPYALPPLEHIPRRPVNPYIGRRAAFAEGEAVGIAQGEAVGIAQGEAIQYQQDCAATGTCGVPGGYAGSGVYRSSPARARGFGVQVNGPRGAGVAVGRTRERVASALRY
jgi:hypothetical protein